MIPANDYLQEVRKFASSQYWYSGLRITGGVMVPLVVLIVTDQVAAGIPFLWGSLFVSLTDTPGPIHHRRNGMFVAVVLNAVLVLVTGIARNHQILLFVQIVIAAFVLPMAGVYGARANAVGSLALVVALLTLLSIRSEAGPLTDALMVAGGGSWYTLFSLWLYRLRPYRPIEQALGENIIALADYLRARASLYNTSHLAHAFTRVMTEQSRVQRLQDQSRELLFKTRTFVSDPSPRSRTMMMIYLHSVDLFEQLMHSYHDYSDLKEKFAATEFLTRMNGLVHQLAAAMEYVGLAIQAGRPVRRDVDLNSQIGELRDWVHASVGDERAVMATRILDNAQDIANGINKFGLYTRAEAEPAAYRKAIERVGHKAITQPVTLELFIRNLTLKSNTFRHALRLTIAIAFGYGVALFFSLTHPYWLLLTIVTIMRPVYALSRKRNIARLSGTLVGVLLVFGILKLVNDAYALLPIMIVSMLIGYSLLRLHYFGFVVFLTVFIVISFHFLNPVEFSTMIQERVVDTVIGSVIAFLASRFVFPAWEGETINATMARMVAANQQYFAMAWSMVVKGTASTAAYQHARQEALVALTNLSEKFQSMLAEPHQNEASPFIHQFVIASHMLTGHIAGLTSESVEHGDAASLGQVTGNIEASMLAAHQLLNGKAVYPSAHKSPGPIAHQTLNQLSVIYSLSKEILRITKDIVQR